MTQLQQQIAQLLEQDPNLHSLDLAKQLNLPEGQILVNLPSNFIKVLDGQQALEILQDLTTWGKLTTIIEKDDLIFEFGGEFPQGFIGHGYYNLNIREAHNPNIALTGHLKLENITQVVLLSKPFRSKESYAFCFVTDTGNCGFKVYLGRDEQRRLIPEQVAKFKQLAGLE